MIHYVVLSTGSCGNCYVFHDGRETLLVDCGVTLTKLRSELERHSIPLSSLSALFITHVHPDHAKGAGALLRSTGIPVYVSERCYHTGASEIERQKMDRKQLRTFRWGESVEAGSFCVTGFQTSHDSPGSTGYFIENGGISLFLMTDTGIIPEEAYSYAGRSRVKFIESNYDERMLEDGPYPLWLKQRVRGRYGHLSNTDAVAFASRVSKKGDQVSFIHLSDNNNDVSLLRSLAGEHIESGIFVKCAERGEMFEGFVE